MARLDKWDQIIKEKNINKSFRDFLKEICSLYALNFYKMDGMISQFPTKDRIKGIVDGKTFDANSETMCEHGIDYNFDKDFFTNFNKLFQSIDMFNLNIIMSENCEYASTFASKNCYLSFIIINGCENVCYSFEVKDNCTNLFNSIMVLDNSENIFFGNGISKSFNIFYSKFVSDSSNIRFSTNLIGCQECILCNGLTNQSYCIENKQYSKEEYMTKKKEILAQKDKFMTYFKGLNNTSANLGCTNCEGNTIINSENVKDGIYAYQVKNAKNGIFIGSKDGNENIYSTYMAGSPFGNNYYGCMGVAGGDNIYCSQFIMGSNMYYSFKCSDCSYCIGCVGLKNKSYCILNKQYSKEEWFQLADKIFAQMNDDKILGDAFTGKYNPYYFNDTVAYLLDETFTKEEVEAEGYLWREEKIKVDIPQGATLISSVQKTEENNKAETNNHLSQTNETINNYQGFDSEGKWNIDKEILKKVIVDAGGNYYKIVNMEYQFMIKHGLPIPELHWLDRIKLGFQF